MFGLEFLAVAGSFFLVTFLIVLTALSISDDERD